jgi:hypothetical protein
VGRRIMGAPRRKKEERLDNISFMLEEFKVVED